MTVPKCPICSKAMIKHGKTSAGKQRWRCKECSVAGTNRIGNEAKRLDEFLGWLCQALWPETHCTPSIRPPRPLRSRTRAPRRRRALRPTAASPRTTQTHPPKEHLVGKSGRKRKNERYRAGREEQKRGLLGNLGLFRPALPVKPQVTDSHRRCMNQRLRLHLPRTVDFGVFGQKI